MEKKATSNSMSTEINSPYFRQAHSEWESQITALVVRTLMAKLGHFKLLKSSKASGDKLARGTLLTVVHNQF